MGRENLSGNGDYEIDNQKMVVFALAVALGLLGTQAAGAAALSSISLNQSVPLASATNNTYTITLSSQSSTALRCVTTQFSSISDGTGGAPAGFNANAATVGGNFMSSWSGWTAANTSGTVKTTSATGVTPASGANRQLVLAGTTNGSTANTPVFALIHTYSDQSCTALVDQSTIAFQWTTNTSVSATVDLSLQFAVTPLNGGSCNGAAITGVGSTAGAVSLGTVTKGTRAIGGQQLSIVTNALQGASVYAHVDGPLTDGQGHSIAAVNNSSTSPGNFPDPGTEAFGYTVSSPLGTGDPNRFQGTKWAAMDTADRDVVYSPFTSAPITGCIAYEITISSDTIGGNYGNNVIYTAVPNF